MDFAVGVFSGRSAKLSRREWTAVLISAGMSVFGAAMVILAFVDPDPTSKLGLLVGSGGRSAWWGIQCDLHSRESQTAKGQVLLARRSRDWMGLST